MSYDPKRSGEQRRAAELIPIRQGVLGQGVAGQARNDGVV
jgi:hypothetical protein